MNKKYMIAALFGALLLIPQEADAQAFLKKLKEKAEEAVNKAGEAVNKAVGVNQNQTEDEQYQTTEDSSYEYTATDETDEEYIESRMSYGNGVVQGSDIVKGSRISKLNWDDPVEPSKASQPEALLNALPALPSPAKLANPTEDDQIAFYRAIKAVTMRAEQLDNQNTCSEADQEAFRKKHDERVKKMYKDIYGLTDNEWDILCGKNGTDADREKISAKMIAAEMGSNMMSDDVMAELERNRAAINSMGEEAYMADRTKKMQKAAEQVARKHEAELKKYSGVTIEEMVSAFDAKDEREMEKKNDALMKKVEKFRKTLSSADRKTAEALDKQIGEEMQQAAMAAIDMKESSKYGQKVAEENKRRQAAMADVRAFEEKEKKYIDDMTSLLVEFNNTRFKMQDAAKANYLKIAALKKQIYSGKGDASALFAEAEAMIAKSRESVAQGWVGYLQKYLDKIKANMPKLIALNREAVKDEVLPECAVMREPYNQVIEAGNVLMSAYQEFPSGYPPMYDMAIAETVKIADGESFAWPEVVGVTGANVYESLGLFKTDGTSVYQYVGKNNWKKMPAGYKVGKYMAAKAPKDEVIASKDGKRNVVFNAKGRCLMLPEGDVVTPMCIEKTADAVVWYSIEQKEPNVVVISKCTYKL